MRFLYSHDLNIWEHPKALGTSGYIKRRQHLDRGASVCIWDHLGAPENNLVYPAMIRGGTAKRTEHGSTRLAWGHGRNSCQHNQKSASRICSFTESFPISHGGALYHSSQLSLTFVVCTQAKVQASWHAVEHSLSFCIYMCICMRTCICMHIFICIWSGSLSDRHLSFGSVSGYGIRICIYVTTDVYLYLHVHLRLPLDLCLHLLFYLYRYLISISISIWIRIASVSASVSAPTSHLHLHYTATVSVSVCLYVSVSVSEFHTLGTWELLEHLVASKENRWNILKWSRTRVEKHRDLCG